MAASIKSMPVASTPLFVRGLRIELTWAKRVSAVALLLASIAAASGCHNRSSRTPASDDPVDDYVRLVVQLGERDPDSIDFATGRAATLNALRANPASIATLHQSAISLRDEVTREPESRGFDAERKRRMLAQLDALVLRTEQLQGHNRSFDQESRVLFGVVAPADHEASERAQIRKQLSALLRNPSDLAASYSRYEARFVVPRTRVPRVFEEALHQCRALTILHLALPAGEHVQVEYVVNKPWSAYSRYIGNAQSVIQVNMDYPLTVDRILDLACHEAYPGHHVFNTLRDESLVHARHLEEFEVQPTFSPQSYVSEAAASYAPELALTRKKRLQIERDTLLPLAGIQRAEMSRYLEIERLVARLHTAEPEIARKYLDGSLEFVRADDALEREAAMEHGETELLYLNEFRCYMLTYTLGKGTIESIVESGHPTDAERWQRYRRLMTNPTISLSTSGN